MTRLSLVLLLTLAGCAPRAGTGGAPPAQPGVGAGDGGAGAPAPGTDAGSCPAGQQRCCDGQCDTPGACASLSCDPTPPPPETR